MRTPRALGDRTASVGTPVLTPDDREAIVRFFEAMAAGKCPTCGGDVEPSRRVGRCLYAACGHRLGQVGRR